MGKSRVKGGNWLYVGLSDIKSSVSDSPAPLFRTLIVCHVGGCLYSGKSMTFCFLWSVNRRFVHSFASSTFIILSAAVSVAPCLKKPETVRTELPMRISVYTVRAAVCLVVLVCFVSVIGSPFAASSVALIVPAFLCGFLRKLLREATGAHMEVSLSSSGVGVSCGCCNS